MCAVGQILYRRFEQICFFSFKVSSGLHVNYKKKVANILNEAANVLATGYDIISLNKMTS